MTNRCFVFGFALPTAISALTLTGAHALAETRPLTVDLMVKSENIGEVVFSPSGSRLLLEKLAAYESATNFDLFMYGDERANLLDVDVFGNGRARSITSKDGERIWLTGFSPSGSKAAVGWLDGSVAKAGIYDVASGTLRKLDLPIRTIGGDDFNPHWLSEDEFILFSQPAELQRRAASQIMDWHERRRQLAQSSWKGQEAGVTVLGSGQHWKAAETSTKGALLRIDARTGKASELGSGRVLQLSLSPDRRHFAVLREVGDIDLGGVATNTVFTMDKQLELAVYDLSRGSSEAIPCNSCNVTWRSLSWSPHGTKLFFSTRVVRGNRFEHEYHIYDLRQRALERFVPHGVNLETSATPAAYVTPFAWLTDDTPAVRVAKKDNNGQVERYDWYALPTGRPPVALTAGLRPRSETDALADFVAVHKGKLLIMADGDLWQIAADGTRKNLTASIAEPLSPWCSISADFRRRGEEPVCSGLRLDTVVRPADQDALAKGWLTFRVMQDDEVTGDVLFLNVDSGKTVRIARPDPQAKLVSASALAQSAVYDRKGGDGDRLLLVSAGGATRELLHINQHLDGVVGGKPVLLTRREPGEAEERYDWLLLPPDHKPGQRHPLLVYFYPDRQHTKVWRETVEHDPRSTYFLNMHIPATRGYAVLLASTKLPPSAPSNPMTALHEQLIHAAENAVQAGYADPERWALMGQSFGGYGTNSVITQTNRFKAAIASAGFSNLSSSYANGPADRALGMPAKLTQGVIWSEHGQGRLGGAPWEDPERYIANSPLFFADRIKTPLLLIHGDDDFVNVNEAEQMFNALLRQNKDAKFLRYWGEYHTIRSAANIRHMWQTVIDWLDEHLGVERDE